MTDKSKSFKIAECVAWDVFPSDYLTLIPFGVAIKFPNGGVTQTIPVSIPVLSLLYACVVDPVYMVSI